MTKKIQEMTDAEFDKRIRCLNEQSLIKHARLCEQATPEFKSVEEYVKYYRDNYGDIPMEEYINKVAKDYEV